MRWDHRLNDCLGYRPVSLASLTIPDLESSCPCFPPPKSLRSSDSLLLLQIKPASQLVLAFLLGLASLNGAPSSLADF